MMMMMMIIIIIIIEFYRHVLAVVSAMFSSVGLVITNDQRLTELSLHFQHFPKIIPLQLPTRQCFALLQHWVVSLAFQSTYQILCWCFQGFISLRVRLLPFWVSTVFQSLSLNPGIFPPSLTSAGTTMSMIIPFCSFLSITIMSGLLTSITLISHKTLLLLWLLFFFIFFKSNSFNLINVMIQRNNWALSFD